MRTTRVLTVAAALGICSLGAHAGIIFTFGGDFRPLVGTGAPDSLNSMDPASAASVTNVQTPVGDGSIGFNGGLVAVNNLLYGIGNDGSGVASLFSFQTNGTGLTTVSSAFNTSGDAAGYVFQNGLGAIGNTFYGIGAGPGGDALFQIGAGSATLLGSLFSFNGTFAGMAYDASLGGFYAVIANTIGSGGSNDVLVSFDLTGAVSQVANLSSLDGSPSNTHLGGIADAGGGVLYVIYTNPNTFTGQLEQVTLSPSANTLYDTGIPLAQNAGLAYSSSSAAPEPGCLWLALCGSAAFRIAKKTRKR